MLQRPALAAKYDALPLSRDQVLLRTATGVQLVAGPFWGEIVPFLDGTRTAGEIVDHLESNVPLANTYYALLCLERDGILTEAPSQPLIFEPLTHPGARIGVGDYLDPKLDALAREPSDLPFIPVRLSGDEAWVGPVIRQLPEWDRLVRRLHQNQYHRSTRVQFEPTPAARASALHQITQKLVTDTDCTNFVPDLLARSIGPITGIISGIERLAASPIYVDQAWHMTPIPALAAGKGLTPEAARISCLAEAAERHSMAWTGDEPHRHSSYRDLAGEAVHPSALLQLSATQYAAAGRRPVPDNHPLDWVAARDLTNGGIRYIPTALCYYGHPEAQQFGVVADSNGCAAGPTLDDAIVSGFLELVERDAVALWWYNRIARPAFPLPDLTQSPAVAALLKHLGGTGYTLSFLDLTTDLGIPVAAALVAGPDGVPRDVGFGADFSPSTAIHRAALEAGQLIATPQENVWNWLRSASQLSAPYLRPLPPRRQAMASPAQEASKSRLDLCLHAARKSNVEVLVVDLTRDDPGIPVMRVVCPGLRSPWPRFGPGRLFDAPVRAGWVSKPLTEAQLNPIPYIL